MRRLHLESKEPPLLDDVHFKSLYRKEIYDARTRDGWILQITRYRPVPQAWDQPIFDQPLLLVPGWSQNRHAYTCGPFVKQLLFYGADIHILELRGHGLSSRELQLQRASAEARPLPADIDYRWDLDSYLLEDLPAGIAAVKKRTGRDKVFYVGNSMGGMLGYGYAATHDDLAGLITIGAPSDLGKGFLLLRGAALFGPTLLHPAIDALCTAASSVEVLRHGTAHALRKLRWLRRAAGMIATEGTTPRDLRYRHVPVDSALKALAHAATPANLKRFDRVARYVGSLLNPSRVTAADFRWLLRQGGEKEPRAVVEQFARWIRHDEMRCYRNGFDYRAHFADITVPMAVIFGDLDKIASEASTRSIYRDARSEYLLWRPVKDNSHLELTMGYDIDQTCRDVRDLVVYAARRERGRTSRRGLAAL